MRAVLPNLIFDTPCRHAMATHFRFLGLPLSRHYERSRNAPGGGAGGLVSNAARVLLTHLACDLLLRAVSVERRSRSWCLNDSDVDGPRPCGIRVGSAMYAMPQLPDELLLPRTDAKG